VPARALEQLEQLHSQQHAHGIDFSALTAAAEFVPGTEDGGQEEKEEARKEAGEEEEGGRKEEEEEAETGASGV
jgi:hypothetical protein